MKRLYTLGLREAAARIDRGTMTSAAYTRSCLDRIAQLEGDIMAWAWIDPDRALQRALAADRAHALRSRFASDDPVDALPPAERGVLSGVPVGVKDVIETAGIPTGMGSPVYRDWVPEQSAELVDALDASGAFVMGKTVTTEFAFMVPNKTRNPWNPARTPGGSSSGSAAAVACGMVPAAIGTQTNGSVIRPAAFCGVVGFKPGMGTISTKGMLAFSPTFDQPGVFARDVSDAALLASWLTRHDGEIGHLPVPLRVAPTLAAVRSPVWEQAQPEQRERFAADIAILRRAGATIQERELPSAFDDGRRIHRTIMLYEAARLCARVRDHNRSGFSEFLNRALDEGAATADADYAAAMRARAALIAQLAAFIGDGCAGIITPPAAGEAPTIDTTGDPAFCSLWTLCGGPCLSLPTGLGPNGMPLGLQLVGRDGETNYLLAVAAWCELQFGFEGLLARTAAPR